MLRKVWVDNFRSLENFHLKLEPGLNVLVGPNGAGKTSIMKWFEFISLLSNFSLRESIGKMGGANHVFRRKNGRYADVLQFSLEGDTIVDNRYSSQRTQRGIVIHYHYYGEISIVKNNIYFSKQQTKIWIGTNVSATGRTKEPNIQIIWSYDLYKDSISCGVDLIKPRNKKQDRIENFIFDNIEFLENILKPRQKLESFISPSVIFPIDHLQAIKEDISYKKAFNINPSSVRSAIDISSQPGVQFDGAGLVSTLYELKSAAVQGPMQIYSTDKQDDGKYEVFTKVLSYFKLSDPKIHSIDPTIDNFRNEFLLEVEYHDQNGPYNVPVFLLSDGTVKWLAIVTALSTEKKSLFIEEPENFLHPKLQESIVEIIREEIGNSTPTRFAVMTTHSETLLNKLRPHEIIVTSMVNAKTVSMRVDNPDEISEIIAESGFGLGYFYVSGGF